MGTALEGESADWETLQNRKKNHINTTDRAERENDH